MKNVIALEENIKLIKDEGVYMLQDTTVTNNPPEFILLGNKIQTNKFLSEHYPKSIIS